MASQAASIGQMQPQIVVLKEGTVEQQGLGQILNNISACMSIADTVRTTLGPCGMDKLIVDANGSVTISNDGATIMKLLDIVHPCGRMLVDASRSQDSEIGDGTTSVVIFAAELMECVKPLLESKVHPKLIASGYMKAAQLAVQKVNEYATRIPREDKKKFRAMLEGCSSTAISSKLISHNKEYFSKMVVDAVMSLDINDLNEKLIGIKKIPGGAVQESFLVNGVAFKKTFSYAGFEQQPKSFVNPKIISLNVELELKAERDNAEVRIKSVQDYQGIVDSEWEIIYRKLDSICKSGANIVLSKLPIGDLAMQYFADRGVFSAGRVPDEDLQRVLKAVGGQMLASVGDIKPEHIGTCAHFEERQIGDERYNIFEGCTNARSCTLILRGGAEQFIAEVERSLHDSIMVVKRALVHESVVAGGGAIEMRLSKDIRDYAKQLEGKDYFIFNAFAKALEIIPRQLCDNAGLDTTDLMNKLRYNYSQNKSWLGVNVASGSLGDNYQDFIWEPPLVKTNMISSATEAACIVLTTDYTIVNPSKATPTMADMPVHPQQAGRNPGMPIR